MAAPNLDTTGARSRLLTCSSSCSRYGRSGRGQHHTPKLGLDLARRHQRHPDAAGHRGRSGPITRSSSTRPSNIIRQRVDGFGVAEAEVTTQGSGANRRSSCRCPASDRSSRTPSPRRPSWASGRSWPPPEESATTAPTRAPTPEPTATGSASPKPKKSAKASPKASGNGACRAPAGCSPAADAHGLAGRRPPRPRARPDRPAPQPARRTTRCCRRSRARRNDAALQAKYDELDCTATGRAHRRRAGRPDAALVTCSTDGAAKYILGAGRRCSAPTSPAPRPARRSRASAAGSSTCRFNGEGAKKFAEDHDRRCPAAAAEEPVRDRARRPRRVRARASSSADPRRPGARSPAASPRTRPPTSPTCSSTARCR